MHRVRLFAALLCVVCFAATAPAHATDMPAPAFKMPVKATLPPYDWSGFYAGGVIGGALQNTIFDDKDCNLSCSSWNVNGSGATAGFVAGWNYQFGHAVVGLEGDIDWDNFKGSFTDPNWTAFHSAKWNGFGTLRARAGLAFDRVLMYATGGLAFVKIDDFGQNGTTGTCGNGNNCFDVSGVKTGFAAGVGVEFGLSGPWSVKAEYLYIGLPSIRKHDDSPVHPETYNTYAVMSDAQILRLGLNYRFGSSHTTPYAWAPKGGSAWAAVGSGANWTGFYAGVTGGRGLQNGAIDDKNCNSSCSEWNLDGSGFTVGGTVGWNYQFGPGLVGIEADINWDNFDKSFTDVDWGSNGTTHSEKWNWFATVRGRAGLVVNRALIYATGGLALVDVNANLRNASGNCTSQGCFDINGTKAGLAVGVGTEYALTPNWTVKSEYLYVDLPTLNAHDEVRTSTYNTYNYKSDAHIVRVGLNYHPSPIGTGASMPVQKLAQWNGFYVGANVGGGLQNTIMDDKNCNLSCSSQHLNGSGATAGGTVGWNHQMGAYVFGVEGDFNWDNFKDSFTDPNWNGFGGTIHSAQWDWFATARARAGVTIGHTLLYATTGFAFVHVNDYGDSPDGSCISGCFSVSGVKTGLAVGVGAEYALSGPWSVKGEYLYVDLPTENTHDLKFSPTWATYNVKSDAHILRLGLNYHF